MTPAAGPALRSSLRATLGGRSVALAAGRIEAASLRTLPLVGVPRLLALTDPLAALLAGPPTLEQLRESVDRASAERTAPQAPSAGRPAAREQVASPRSDGSTRTAREPHRAPVLDRGGRSAPAEVPAPSGRPAPAGRAAPSGRARPLASPRRLRAEAGSPPAAPAARAADSPLPSASPPSRASASPPSPVAPPVDLDVAALARAARADVTSAPAPVAVPQQSPTTSRPVAPRIPVAPSTPTPARTPAAPVGGPATPVGPGTADPVPVGALGELLSRWDTTAAAAEPAPAAGSRPALAAQHARSPFAPLTSRLAEHADTADLWDSPGDAPLVLDTVQLALDALLRREAEQHGLGSGLG